MKRKNLIFLATAVSVVGLLALTKERHRLREDHKQEDMMAQLRSYFSQKGDIQVVYVNTYDKSDEATTGGVVMEDGRQFEFTYYEGEILSREVNHD
ncbi:DUF4651 domain-containing protein [Streptococcus saliviloxodontae]|uniref:DUF4651 domain-containing protein n=1 Tax=Streptococcus saliviloxodontae TaxID=1349416 RepID=A0ABS2PMP3_9STRE|nr:DUF4651 domain-containing protein [Streptococcus saliviloxodontae]MBM7636709.1 hypothetical protein [Streptococcus saliviloxodontae]